MTRKRLLILGGFAIVAFFGCCILLIVIGSLSSERPAIESPATEVISTPTALPTAPVELPTSEPTATPEPPTETATAVPTEMPLPTTEPPSQPSGPHVVIVGVNKRAEYVDIQNTGDAPQDLTGWRLLSERGAQDCPLAGVIQPGETLRVWAMAEDAGQGGFNCGFGTTIWNNSEPDAAILFDPAGAEMSRF